MCCLVAKEYLYLSSAEANGEVIELLELVRYQTTTKPVDWRGRVENVSA